MDRRFYFHLRNGDSVIRDKIGVEVADMRTAMIYAFEAIEELYVDSLHPHEDWQGWYLDVIDEAARAVCCIPLDGRRATFDLEHQLGADLTI